jgi:hypothetical protein
MEESKLFIMCVTAVVISVVASVTYYNSQQSASLSKNVEFAITKGIDPVAVRCAYSNSSDNVCIAYALGKK